MRPTQAEKQAFMKSNGFLAILVIVILSYVTGCSKDEPLSRQSLIGNYVINYSHGVENLELKVDGTFTQQYNKTNQNSPSLNSGKWEVDIEYHTLYLRDALIFDTGRDELRIPPAK